MAIKSEIPPIPLLSKPLQMFIGGEWLKASRTFATIDPASGEVLAHAPEGLEADIDRAVAIPTVRRYPTAAIR